MSREDFLKHPVNPIEVNDKSISELLKEMQHTAFQGRKLGEAVEIWLNMLKESSCVIFLGLSGAMIPAGMRRIISYIIEQRFADCIVSTGANLFHDLHEALGKKHYIGRENVNDAELFRCNIDRIYDVFADEKEFEKLDRFIAEFADELDEKKVYSSREFLFLLARKAEKHVKEKNSILLSSLKAGIPIFAPAIADSSIGIGLALAKKKGKNIVIDTVRDICEITKLACDAEKTGVVYIGGGVPKNFIQQIEIVKKFYDCDAKGHEYAIQFTTDSPHFGGLSGCTFEEAISWGKISHKAKKVQVFVDATIALPIVVHALSERVKKEKIKRKIPEIKI